MRIAIFWYFSLVMRLTTFCLFSPALLTAMSGPGTALAAENWPQWRGPHLNGTCPATQLPSEWSETQNVRWKVPLPSWSAATPIIWGDRIFITSPSPKGDGPQARTIRTFGGSRPAEGTELFLLCFAKADGSLLWRRQLADDNVHYYKQNMSSPSPVTDGRHVWVMTGTGVLSAFDRQGEQIWQRDLQEDYGRFEFKWGYASSPLLFDRKLIVEVLHRMETDVPSYIAAFEPASGETIWKVERAPVDLTLAAHAYTTPTLLPYPDRTEIVIGGADYVSGHDPATGAETWRCRGLKRRLVLRSRVVSSPLAAGGMVYVAAKDNPLLAIRAGGRGDVTDTHLAWTSRLAPDVPTPVSDGNYLYILHDEGFISCLDAASGKPYYKKRRLARGTYSASPLLAGARIYVTSESAMTTILATGPEFKVLGVNRLDDGYTLSSIAVAGRQLFIRTSKHLYCIEEQQENSAGGS